MHPNALHNLFLGTINENNKNDQTVLIKFGPGATLHMYG